MKRLDDYMSVREFVRAQGIRPTIAMVACPDPEWQDLVHLAQEWEQFIAEQETKQEALLDGFDEGKIGIQREAEEQREQLEREKLLYHSSGYRPSQGKK